MKAIIFSLGRIFFQSIIHLFLTIFSLQHIAAETTRHWNVSVLFFNWRLYIFGLQMLNKHPVLINKYPILSPVAKYSIIKQRHFNRARSTVRNPAPLRLVPLVPCFGNNRSKATRNHIFRRSPHIWRMIKASHDVVQILQI